MVRVIRIIMYHTGDTSLFMTVWDMAFESHVAMVAVIFSVVLR